MRQPEPEAHALRVEMQRAWRALDRAEWPELPRADSEDC